jgi:hypothetical protein
MSEDASVRRFPRRPRIRLAPCNISTILQDRVRYAYDRSGSATDGSCGSGETPIGFEL